MEIYIKGQEDTDTLVGILTRNGYIVSSQPLVVSGSSIGLSERTQSWKIKTYDLSELTEAVDADLDPNKSVSESHAPEPYSPNEGVLGI